MRTPHSKVASSAVGATASLAGPGVVDRGPGEGSEAVRVVLPLPPGTVVCLCCGPLPAVLAADSVGRAHSAATGHPTMWRPEAPP